MKYLLDSVILIDHLNGIEAATEQVRKRAGELAISAITRAEVLAGLDDEGAELVTSFLDRFAFLAIDAAIADEAARVRRRTRLRLPDALQAATALRHGLKLITRNTKDFPPARFPFVILPYQLP